MGLNRSLLAIRYTSVIRPKRVASWNWWLEFGRKDLRRLDGRWELLIGRSAWLGGISALCMDTKRGSVWQCCIHACLDDVKKLRSLITVQFNECATSIFWGTSFSYVLSCCQEQWSPMHTARKERKTRERPRIARLLLYEIIDFLFVIVVII